MNDHHIDLHHQLAAAPTHSAEIGLSIVVPVYRGAATIGRLVDTLSALRPTGGLEIVLVNDGSPDNSGEACQELVQRAVVPLTYIEHARNYGEHNAVMTGLRHVRGAYVITMDDDLQNPPEEVIRLYDHARLGNWDVVYTRYGVKQHAGWRNLGSRFANSVADRLLDKPKGLYLSSFRCMSALVVHSVTRYTGPYPYVDGLIMQVTQRIDSIEVRHLPRVEGRSNYNLTRLVRLWLNLATSFSLAPLRLAIYAGIVMALLGTIGAVATMAEALIMRNTPSGWASTMTVILLVAGVQSMILGVLGEYVGRTFLTSNGKPQGTVRMFQRNTAAENIGGVTAYWLTLFAAITTSMAGQTLLKAGAGAVDFITQLFDWRTLFGLGLYGGAAILYIIALRRIPMSQALPCTAVSYVVAALIGHYGFGEPMGTAHVAAIGLICAGVVVLALA